MPCGSRCGHAAVPLWESLCTIDPKHTRKLTNHSGSRRLERERGPRHGVVVDDVSRVATPADCCSGVAQVVAAEVLVPLGSVEPVESSPSGAGLSRPPRPMPPSSTEVTANVASSTTCTWVPSLFVT